MLNYVFLAPLAALKRAHAWGAKILGLGLRPITHELRINISFHAGIQIIIKVNENALP